MTTIKELKKALKLEDSLFSTFFYRPISLRITYLLIKTNITPNQVTFFSLVLGLISAAIFILGSYFYSILGIIFLNLSFLMDHVDGEIARYKNLKSSFGAWFDQITDRIKESSALFGMTIGVYNNMHNYTVFVFGMLAIFNLFMIGHIRGTTSQLGFEHKAQLKISKKVHIGSIDTTVFLITIGAIFNLFYYVLAFYAIFVPLAWVYQIYTRYRRCK